MPSASAPALSSHPSDPLSPSEIRLAASISRSQFSASTPLRFNTIALHEPSLSSTTSDSRQASVLLTDLSTSTHHHLILSLSQSIVLSCNPLLPHQQPPLTPSDCFLAESLAKSSPRVIQHAKIHDLHDVESQLVCDPWSVHLLGNEQYLHNRPNARLVQLFLYAKFVEGDNHYAHPLPGVPIVDLLSGDLVHFDHEFRVVQIPRKMLNYRADLLENNTYLAKSLKPGFNPLQVRQPKGVSFRVEGTLITWGDWSLRVGFTPREGVVLHDVSYAGRQVLARAAVVEMAVPYGDPHAPFARKCAFDVGDYGLGFCTDSLTAGCDCLGAIHYFDGILSDENGEPSIIENAICVHEEDAGVLYKHVEYRDGHAEVRRARRLVISFVATVVNYEYLFYWYVHVDGSIGLEIKLSGELSTNVLSEGEQMPDYGTLVAEGVNAQIHQHMFCVRLDPAVDGANNAVSEFEFVREKRGNGNLHANAFKVKETVLRTEKEARREAIPGRVWKIWNVDKTNSISGKKRAYKLVPGGVGGVGLLTGEDSMVNRRGRFAEKNLWVTRYREGERYAAGEYVVQGKGGDGVREWGEGDEEIVGGRLVLWHSFGVAHMPRVEDFPIMNCEVTGFVLKPDGFFDGNPAVGLPEETKKENGSVHCS